MKSDLLLDTNAYSDFGRRLKWLDVIPYAAQIFIPLMVIGELRSGFRNGRHFQKNEDDLQDFLSQGTVRVLAPDLQTTFHYSIIFTDLKSRGIIIPQNDLWIAALAVQHGLWLCTSDAHFDHLPQLLRIQS
ncbi:type II toxin-antitoxin system VapC family toxin [Luteolibacter pohnpeiensis]|uniref:Type II toxin-antitoxin system VapC family toxin n=1 Tax=Luteolibacter pohnpeiensis TaxID=454153 RepID=A0A934VWX1_9BACT|nr:type II toxin-antitoxin system VapC family toxin [Luteolibacter pohnpeiensis]MBK1882964.1 type II toxin-antitoxin system VapC family toxin [Luteolibacter pohnpeiensis]